MGDMSEMHNEFQRESIFSYGQRILQEIREIVVEKSTFVMAETLGTVRRFVSNFSQKFFAELAELEELAELAKLPKMPKTENFAESAIFAELDMQSEEFGRMNATENSTESMDNFANSADFAEVPRSHNETSAPQPHTRKPRTPHGRTAQARTSQSRTPQGRRRRRLACLAVLIIVGLLLAPSPFAIEMPGPTANVLGAVSASSDDKMIDISGVTTYKDKGELRLVTISATGVPGYTIPTAMAMYAWFNPQMAVMPQEAVYSVDTTAEEYKDEGDNEMTEAQNSATEVGLAYASDQLGINTSKAKVKVSVDDIGGPSAGMMYTLGIISKLTPQDEAGGKIIAGTGTIETDGSVGRIGGIQLKMIGALRDGAHYFIAPEGNCDEVVGHIPSGMRVFAVSNINEAYKTLVAIGKGGTSNLRGCTAKTAQ